MIEIPVSPQHNSNAEKSGVFCPCVVCGKAVTSANPWMLRLFWGTTAVTESEARQIIAEQGEGGDLGMYPIGAECLRRNPALRPYAIRQAADALSRDLEAQREFNAEFNGLE